MFFPGIREGSLQGTASSVLSRNLRRSFACRLSLRRRNSAAAFRLCLRHIIISGNCEEFFDEQK